MVTGTHSSDLFVEFKKEEVEQSIAQRFELQAHRYPDGLAVKSLSHKLTYGALERAANRAARAIVAQCGRASEPVVLVLNPGPMMIVAMLGVLKAGKVWVPLDPSYPQPRMAYILENAGAALVLTDTRNVATARALVGAAGRLMNVDEIGQVSDERLDLAISPEEVACILYTSGSTGQPKGVVHSHRNLLHTVMQYTNSLRITADDRLSLLPSFSHMAGVNTIFRGLLNGAAVLPYDVKTRGLAGLAGWLRQEEVTIYNSAPTLFRHLVSTLRGTEAFPRLRIILLGGEVLHKRDAMAYKAHFGPHCVLVNNLGCTELSSYRQYFIHHATEIEGDTVPVGFAVEDRDVLLLDDAGQKVGPGQDGEITVRSPYLALGYWRRPDLTQEVFLNDPTDERIHMYRTGDLGRMLADGRLIHLGRKDWQVKIRGYRVELAEVEMALLEHPAVKEATVATWEGDVGDTRLVAYVVPDTKPAPATSELQHFTRQRLADYMVPAWFVFMEALPLTSNGKVNRQALPAPTPSRPALATPFVAPRTPLEEKLAGIWTQLLDTDQVGVNDDFFELGGHSLLATQMISRIHDLVGVELAMQCLFETPTVADLALLITQKQAEQLEQEELERLLDELEALSDEDTQAFLTDNLAPFRGEDR